MKTIKGWAKVDYNIEWTGTPGALVALADQVSSNREGEGLDSLDLGDAMGYIMKCLDQQPNGKLIWDNPSYGRLTAEKNYDTFVWEGLS